MRYVVFRSHVDPWQWKPVSRNSRIIAESVNGIGRRQTAKPEFNW